MVEVEIQYNNIENHQTSLTLECLIGVVNMPENIKIVKYHFEAYRHSGTTKKQIYITLLNNNKPMSTEKKKTLLSDKQIYIDLSNNDISSEKIDSLRDRSRNSSAWKIFSYKSIEVPIDMKMGLQEKYNIIIGEKEENTPNWSSKDKFSIELIVTTHQSDQKMFLPFQIRRFVGKLQVCPSYKNSNTSNSKKRNLDEKNSDNNDDSDDSNDSDDSDDSGGNEELMQKKIKRMVDDTKLVESFNDKIKKDILKIANCRTKISSLEEEIVELQTIVREDKKALQRILSLTVEENKEGL